MLLKILPDTVRRNPQGGRPESYYVAGRGGSVQVLHGMGTFPYFDFSYENPLVACEYCKQEFPVDAFEEDWEDTMGDGSYCIPRKCPECGTGEAIEEPQYETLSYAELEQLAKLNEERKPSA